MFGKRFFLVMLAGLILSSCNNKITRMPTIETFVLRLKPGMDLKKSIQDFVNEHQVSAGWIVTCVGSLTQYSIRFANQQTAAIDSGHFEIVSMAGTLSKNGSHIHISVSDSTGRTFGGHLADGNIIYTTAEIVIQSSEKYIFTRKQDGTTPWQELQVDEVK